MTTASEGRRLCGQHRVSRCSSARSVLAAIILLASVSVSCDPIDQVLDRIAIARRGDSVQILYYACGEEVVRRVRVAEIPAGTAGERGDEIWRIEGRSKGPAEFAWDYGETPPGWRTTRPAIDLVDDRTYRAEVTSDGQNFAAVGFTMTDIDRLESDEVLTTMAATRRVPQERFWEAAADACV